MRLTASIVLLAISACAGNDLYRNAKEMTAAVTKAESSRVETQERLLGFVERTEAKLAALEAKYEPRLDQGTKAWLDIMDNLGLIVGAAAMAVAAFVATFGKSAWRYWKTKNGKPPITGPAK